MRSIKAIPAGGEIFNTYGELSNIQLIHHHGFASPVPTPFERAGLELKTLVAALELSASAADGLKRLVPSLEAMSFIQLCNTTHPPTHSLTHSLIHPLSLHSLTHSRTHSLTHS